MPGRGVNRPLSSLPKTVFGEEHSTSASVIVPGHGPAFRPDRGTPR